MMLQEETTPLAEGRGSQASQKDGSNDYFRIQRMGTIQGHGIGCHIASDESVGHVAKKSGQVGLVELAPPDRKFHRPPVQEV